MWIHKRHDLLLSQQEKRSDVEKNVVELTKNRVDFQEEFPQLQAMSLRVTLHIRQHSRIFVSDPSSSHHFIFHEVD